LHWRIKAQIAGNEKWYGDKAVESRFVVAVECVLTTVRRKFVKKTNYNIYIYKF
jgi:hypothetical protein